MATRMPSIKDDDLTSLDKMTEIPLDLASAELVDDTSFKDTDNIGMEEGFELPVEEHSVEEYPVDVIEGIDDEVVNSDQKKDGEQDNQTNENKAITVPCFRMKFGSLEEVKDFYRKYASSCGFGTIVRSSCTKVISPTEKRKYHTLACDKSGKPRGTSDNSLKPQPTKKTDCKARINVQEFEDGKVIISQVILKHNHDLSPGKSRYHRCNKELDPWVKRKLDLNDQAGISLSKNFQSLVVQAGGYENLTFGQSDARNYIQKARILRLGEGDAESLNNYFVKMQKINSSFYYAFDWNDDGQIKNIFWADARSRALYESFGDVITFDTTYLTNKYDMPFAPFVGVNHHGQSILLGCGLLSNEKVESYVWLFKSWLECMSGILPNAIVTDQCQSIRGAISIVFKGVKHRFCLWHIMKKIPIKLNRLPQYKAIKKSLKNIMYESLTVEEFEKSWTKFVAEYNLEDNEWLGLLYSERKHWILAFLKDTFWAGMSTTQRSESMNAFFDGYVHSKTSLKQFVEQYDHALRDKVEKEKQADFASYNSIIPTITRFHIEKQFQNAYTNEVFKLFQNELRGLMYCNTTLVKVEGALSIFKVRDSVDRKDGSTRKVAYDVYFDTKDCDISCSCHLFEFRGIVCRHVMAVFELNDVKEIPSKYMLDRWRKDIKRKHTYVRSSYDSAGDAEEMIRHDMLCDRFRKVADLGARSDKRAKFVLKIMDYATNELLKEEQESVEQLNSEEIPNVVNEVNHARKKLLSPKKVRSKGRPPTKRKRSKEEQFSKPKRKKVESNVGSTKEAPDSAFTK